VYVQEASQWLSYEAGKEVRATPGRIPDPLLSRTYEIGEEEATALIRERTHEIAAILMRRPKELAIPRRSRDACLGTAALVLSAGYLLNVAASGVLVSHATSPISWGTTGLLVHMVAGLARAFGFVVGGWAFLGEHSQRASRARVGALLIAGGYAVMAVSALLIDAMHIGQFLACLVSAWAFVWASRAMGTEDPRTTSGGADARNVRLGRAGRWFAVAVAWWVLGDLLAALDNSGTGVRSVVSVCCRVLADTVLLTALMVAARGCYGAARGNQGEDSLNAVSDDSVRVARREAYLAEAAGLYALSGLFAVVGAALSLQVWGPVLELWSAFFWLNTLAAVGGLLAGIVATAAFWVSHRSLRLS
jgi:hypothetical protein